jgi:MYXO-CTERM domain-containing protein
MRSSVVRICGYSLGVIAMLIGLEGLALAGTIPSTPEIDGGTISAGLGVLAAGLLILRSRRRTK